METHGLTELVVKLVFQFSIILFAAKIAGEFTERVLKQPGVLGELAIGILIGPYALGSKISIPTLGVLFPLNEGGVAQIPISPELYSIAQIAVIVLLFTAGVETDLQAFLRYAKPATIIAVGGVVFPFIFGDVVTVLMGFADNFMDPVALFMGAALTATSVGITARVLSDLNKLNTPEGVTILAGAVVDDVLGILVLAIVVSIGLTGAVSIGKVSLIALKAVGFWLVLMTVGILTADYVAKILKIFKASGAMLTLAFALGLLFSAIAEMFGLAMIIGAYAIGLSLSKTDIKEELVESLMPLYHALVPVFFVVMGMLVDLRAVTHALLFGIVLTIVAIIGKVAGCGLPALTVGFNRLGSTRIGFGMLPRGEVALIIAGVAITKGVIKPDMYGVAVLMTMVTTLMAPVILVPLFKKRESGLRTLKK
jgi:Kef-type K+ transport system membrane component KefB